ncbi:MAG: bifunctional glutamate N-acetyltransferase/amino-acid acetyltransferase ArgJ [Actinomycetaceae bacterium]|nr:bifunctional glutamate N-acetyltransferase/amino-acid acetyltransferase ArgJ [Actinomycetaceae bacterium]MDU0970171.1 bifunctional glutamate N-acetyltransferase/amino-acid acetyltransferase ArgJ [Actinomycetaceae bacterium]
MSVTAAQGFLAAGVAASIKSTGKPDVALVVNQGPQFVAAGQFTSNRFAAAPVVVSRDRVAAGHARAVILNSGCANACTGQAGLADAEETCHVVADELDCAPTDVLVCSTGMIGVPLPMDKLLSGVAGAAAALSPDGGNDAAEAIRTTDTKAKEAQVAGPGYVVGGMAKGAGMLAPGLATMLVVITTDAVISPQLAQSALTSACQTTFNRVDSDGCMSTNDTVLLLASGASGTEPDGDQFAQSLSEVCAALARQLVADAEGSSHDIAVTVTNARTEAQAEDAARVITRSNLFKAAIFGNDPNWGRIVSALGTLAPDACPFDPDEVDVTINEVMICRGGQVGDDRDLVDLTPREVHVTVDLKAGSAQATVWTNDLTYDYVEENSAYSS